ncbi:hypothetical protein [Nonomuraea sp. NPDC049709]|uniref:hypothetical protein n=1 Tax=Nonomuraea sp. NPDC049709 TaxID=3154736 RepID=UPI0034167D1C
MRFSPTARAFVAGMLVANSAPHLATAVTGHRHLTPVAGKTSGPGVNLVWGLANLAGGLALVRSSARAGKPGDAWDGRLVAFEGGCLVFAAWMAASERFFPMNHE